MVAKENRRRLVLLMLGAAVVIGYVYFTSDSFAEGAVLYFVLTTIFIFGYLFNPAWYVGIAMLAAGWLLVNDVAFRTAWLGVFLAAAALGYFLLRDKLLSVVRG